MLSSPFLTIFKSCNVFRKTWFSLVKDIERGNSFKGPLQCPCLYNLCSCKFMHVFYFRKHENSNLVVGPNWLGLGRPSKLYFYINVSSAFVFYFFPYLLTNFLSFSLKLITRGRLARSPLTLMRYVKSAIKTISYQIL